MNSGRINSDKIIQHFRKGEIIIPEGMKGDRGYQIVEGNVLIYKKNVDGKMVPLARLGKGEIFGEMYLFEASGVRTASAVAADDVKVEVIFFAEGLQQELQETAPELHQMMSSFTRRLRNMTSNFTARFKEKMIVEHSDGTVEVVDHP